MTDQLPRAILHRCPDGTDACILVEELRDRYQATIFELPERKLRQWVSSRTPAGALTAAEKMIDARHPDPGAGEEAPQ